MIETSGYKNRWKTVKKTKSLKLEINEDEEFTLGSEKIDLVDTFIYLTCIDNKDGRRGEDVKVQ